MGNTVAFRLLGRFEVSVDGVVLHSLRAARLQSLLGYLALQGEVPLSRQRAAFLHWPDTTEHQARTNLRRLLFQIRHEHPALAQCLRTAAGRLAWGAEITLRADVRDLWAAERCGDDPRVLALYVGDLLPECNEDWVMDERRRLQVAFIGALERRVEQLERVGQYADAIALVRRRIRIDPLHEHTYRKLIQLHGLRHDLVGATQTYRALEGMLDRELGIGPSRLTRMMLQHVLHGPYECQEFFGEGLWQAGVVGEGA